MKLRRLLYRKLAPLGTLQDLFPIAPRPPKQVVIIRPIGDQSAGLDVLAEGIDGGQFVLDRELRDAAALAHQKSVRRYHQSVPALRDSAGPIDLSGGMTPGRQSNIGAHAS